METVRFPVVLVFALLVFLYTGEQRELSLAQASRPGCDFTSIYNFGDSNSDTGAVSAAFGPIWPPYGQTLGKPSGRASDGRLIIDFIAEELGFPHLSSYLDAIEGEFRHGANFAAIQATIQPIDAKLCIAGSNPFSLPVQCSQFEQFKNRTIQIYSRAKNTAIKSFLPKPKTFSRPLFTMDIGQNDLHVGLQSGTEEAVSSIPNITDRFSIAVEKLYKLGARAFWIHNTGPIGCVPLFTRPPVSNTDSIGCIKSYNEVAQEFNKQLKERISKLRNQFRDAMLVYVDVYSAKYSLISQGRELGFPDPLASCCGKPWIVGCGRTIVVNGTEVHGSSCSNPSEHIFWDTSVHYTEAANKWVFDRIVDGSLSEPGIPIAEACYKPS